MKQIVIINTFMTKLFTFISMATIAFSSFGFMPITVMAAPSAIVLSPLEGQNFSTEQPIVASGEYTDATEVRCFYEKINESPGFQRVATLDTVNNTWSCDLKQSFNSKNTPLLAAGR